MLSSKDETNNKGSFRKKGEERKNPIFIYFIFLEKIRSLILRKRLTVHFLY